MPERRPDLELEAKLDGQNAVWNYQNPPGGWKFLEEEIQDEVGIPLPDLIKLVGASRLITYGYGALSNITDLNYLDRIRYSLARNTAGAIIVSTSKLNRICQYQKLLEGQHDL